MAAEPSSQPSFTPRRRWAVGLDMVLRTVVVLAVVVMVNYLAGKFFRREYLSSQTRTDLAPRTVNFVRSLTNDVKVTLYYNRDDDLFSMLQTLLREYQALNPRIRVEVVDYLRDAAEAQRVKLAYKLPEMQKDDEKNFIIFDAGNDRWKTFNGNLLADYQIEVDQERKHYDKRPTAFKGEMLVNSGLLAVNSAKTLKAYALEGHGEHSLESGDEVAGYRDFWSVLAQNKIAVENLSLTGTNQIPADCDLLIIAGPRVPMLNEELEKIDQYLNEGGRLFALFNAVSTDRISGLERILSRWNVIVSLNSVQDAEHSINSLRSAPGADIVIGAFSEHPAVKPLLGYNLDLILPRPVVPARSADAGPESPRVTILFTTEPTATVVGDPRIKPRSYPLAVAVERPPLAGVVTARGATRMIVVGDSLFLANGPMKLLANRDFADYALNWLVERNQFTEGVGPRPMKDYRIALTVSQMKTVQWLLLGALPGGILLFGGLVWLRRLK